MITFRKLSIKEMSDKMIICLIYIFLKFMRRQTITTTITTKVNKY